ncbi:MAG: hypothetical protein ACT4NJ_07910 [Nitrosopumilaceae archaeon]
MSYFVEINMVNSMIVFFAAAIPIYLSFHLKNKLRILTILLSIFAVIHAIYHATEVFGYTDIAEGILEPLSVVLLISFGLVYLRMIRVRRIHA